MQAYLAPASNSLRVAANPLATFGIRRDTVLLIEAFALNALKENEQLAAFFVGEPSGDSLSIEKMPDRSLHKQSIEQTDGGRGVTWIRRDPSGKEIAKEIGEDDPFDPRTRP